MSQVCRYFRKCSGCSNLEVPYAKQLRDKDKRVHEALSRHFKPGVDPFQALEPSPLPLGYRASTKLCLSSDDFGRRAIGLYVRDSKQVVDIPTCPVHHHGINQLVQKWFAGSAPIPAPFYQHAKRTFQPGRLKFVTVRMSPSTGMAGVILSHTGVDDAALRDWATKLDTRKVSVYASRLSKDDATRIISNDVMHLAGPEKIAFAVGQRQYELSPLAFFQANFSLTGAFIDHITERDRGDGSGILLDLYGGFGAYSYASADAFKKIYLVDGNDSAIDAASRQREVPPNLRPIVASVEDFLTRHKELAKDAREVTSIIVNPPRSGLSTPVKNHVGGKALPNLRDLTYVSCSLDTLTRDVGELVKRSGWSIKSVRGFDMFPQTDHIEVVVKMVRT